MTIDTFSGQYRFLSNFWPCTVHLDSIAYATVEHAYQAAKSLDPAQRVRVWRERTALDAKHLGRLLRPLRPDWETYKFEVMLQLLREKFAKGTELSVQLERTGAEELVEGNTWGDRVWGVYKGQGENRLGRLLMQVRDENWKKPKPPPRVFNRRVYAPPDAIYVGRPSPWGNPFEAADIGGRDAAIAQHRAWLLAQPDLVARVKQELRGKNLECWCAPKTCHADVLLEVANA